jgi:hypothetical protein
VIRLVQQGARPVALALVLLYLVLGVAASACLFDPSASTQSSQHQHQHHRHHQGSGPVHSTLCAWACQVNPAQGLISAAPQMTPQFVATFFLLALSSFPVIRYGSSLRSRAPPR